MYKNFFAERKDLVDVPRAGGIIYSPFSNIQRCCARVVFILGPESENARTTGNKVCSHREMQPCKTLRPPPSDPSDTSPGLGNNSPTVPGRVTEFAEIKFSTSSPGIRVILKLRILSAVASRNKHRFKLGFSGFYAADIADDKYIGISRKLRRRRISQDHSVFLQRNNCPQAAKVQYIQINRCRAR